MLYFWNLLQFKTSPFLGNLVVLNLQIMFCQFWTKKKQPLPCKAWLFHMGFLAKLYYTKYLTHASSLTFAYGQI